MEKIRYHAVSVNPDLTLEHVFGRKPDEMIRQAELSRVLGDSIVVLSDMFDSHGLSFSDNLISRLHVISPNDYMILRMKGVSAALSSGLAIDGHAFIDHSVISRYPHDELSRDDQLRAIGIHELIHVAQYSEEWESPDGSQRKPRRDGLVSFRPRSYAGSHTARGQSLLSEGFTQAVTNEILERVGQYSSDVYNEEVEIFSIIAKKIGVDLFYQAAFTKSGFRALYHGLDQAYGRNAYRRIMETIGGDEWCWIYGNNSSKRAKYSGIKKMLKTEK